MSIWMVESIEDAGWDEYRAHIVRATTEKLAREEAEKLSRNSPTPAGRFTSPKRSRATKVTGPTGLPRVILSDRRGAEPWPTLSELTALEER